MTSDDAIADTTPSRTLLRLVVLGQWIRAGLALARGGGIVGGAVALWRVAQAVRLAMRLARRLAEAERARAARVATVAPGLAPTPDSGLSSADALLWALEDLAAECSAVLRPRATGRPAAMMRSETRDLRTGTRPLGRRASPAPPPARRRRRCRPLALDTTSPPIAAKAIGRLALARA